MTAIIYLSINLEVATIKLLKMGKVKCQEWGVEFIRGHFERWDLIKVNLLDHQYGYGILKWLCLDAVT
jgi:hypothetical protein